MRIGLGARLALAFALLAAVTALVTAGVSTYSTNRQVNADIDGFIRARAADISEGRRLDQAAVDQGRNAQDDGPRRPRPGRGNQQPPQPRSDDDPAAIPDETLAEIRDLVESDTEVQILDSDGNVLVSVGIELPITDIEIALLEREGKPELRTIQVGGEQYRIVTEHIAGGGAVQVAQSLSTTNELLGELRTELLLVGLGMSGLAALVGWGIASRTTRPLRKLARSVEEVAETEDLSTSIALARRDEIGRLSEEFDALLKTLDASREQQHRLVQDAAHELRTPLTSVRANIDFLERAADVDTETRSRPWPASSLSWQS